MISTTKRLLINEWITSSDDSLRELSLDDPIIETVFEFLDTPDGDLELLKAITKKLYEVYQTGDERLRLLTLCFLPPLVAIYIRVAHNYYNLPKLEFHSLAILLLTVYNCEIMEPSMEAIDQGRLKTIDIRVTSLSKPSIYHEPNSHTTNQPVVPTEQNLSKLNNPNESKIPIFGPYEEVEHLLASNYMSVCTVLLKVYNHHISEMGAFSHSSLCQFFLRLLKQGMNIDIKEKIKEYLHDSTNFLHQSQTTHHHLHQRPFKGHHHQYSQQQQSTNQVTNLFVLPRNSVQIQFDSPFLVQLARSIYYCFYNDMTDISFEVMELITKKATLKMYTDVLLMVNAIKNTIAIKHDRDRMIEGTAVANVEKTSIGAPHTTSMNSLNSFTSMGPHESKWSSIRKTAITNASFKTRKLPDDIPIITGNLPSTHGSGIATANTGGLSSSSKSGTPISTRTPPSSSTTSNQNSHHHPHALVLQNSKNLDSIDEESADRLLLANGEERRSTKKTGGKKNSMLNLLKELKEAKPKLPKISNSNKENKENGKLLNNSNHHNSSLNQSKASMDSDTSGLSDGCGKMSLTDGEDGHEIIPMKPLHHYAIKNDTDSDEDIQSRDEIDGSEEVLNGQKDGHRGSTGTTATMTTGGDDDEGASDRSGSSSKGLLSNKPQKPNDSKGGLKLSVQ